MYQRTNVDYGLDKPDDIIYTYCQVYVNDGLHQEEIKTETEVELHWVADTVTQYTLEEWNPLQTIYNQNQHDLSITNAYETSLAVKEE